VRLLGMVARLAAPRRNSRLHRLVAVGERAVESILFLRAVQRFGPPPRRARRPHAGPPGFRRQFNARKPLFFRNAGVRARKAGLVARIACLLAALANPERHIAYFYKRLLRGLHGARLIATAPPAGARTRQEPARLVPIADSS
jgi:hypothetical protein